MSQTRGNKPELVELCNTLSVFRLKEWGLLDKHNFTQITWVREAWSMKDDAWLWVCKDGTPAHIRLIYAKKDRLTGKGSFYDYKVLLETTPCNYAGLRYWFICPLSIGGVPCGRRVAKLHMPIGGQYFGCRHCHKLTYDSREIPSSGPAHAFVQLMRI